MKKLTLALVALAGIACQTALGAVFGIAGSLLNANTEDMVFGATAATTCTVSAQGSPSWTSQPMPASLFTGQSVTWGYANGASGTSSMGCTAGSGFNLFDASVRGVIRGTSNNGGVASVLRAIAPINGNSSGVTHYVTIWGPTLAMFGLTGATNIRWEIRDALSNTLITQGNGEAIVPLTAYNTQNLVTYVFPTTATELGAVFVSYSY